MGTDVTGKENDLLHSFLYSLTLKPSRCINNSKIKKVDRIVNKQKTKVT